MKLWKHQEDTLTKTRKLAKDGIRRIALALPCGSGKTKIMLEIAQSAIAKGKTVAIYSCRRSNTKQIMDVAAVAGITTGVVASEFGKDANSAAPLQVCQMQTVASRLGNYKHSFPFADVVIVDEAHQQTGTQSKMVLEKHSKSGAIVLGFTATPVNMGGLYDHLVCEATHEDLLSCGAHLPVHCYGPDRPDLDRLKTNSDGEFSQQVNIKINEPKRIFGTVLENWKRLDVTSVSGAVSVGIQAKGVLKPGIREKVKHNVVFR